MFQALGKTRIAFGIVIFILGQQIIFYTRERLHQGSEYTAACLLAGMLLMIPSSFISKSFSLQPQISRLLLGWIGLSVFYMYFHINPGVASSLDYFRENSNYIFALAFMYIVTRTPDTVRPYFISVVVVVTLVGSLVLLYSLITNPSYIIGMRATIFYGDGESGGNPHITSRNGFAGFIASAILLKRNNVLTKIFAYLCLCLSLATIVLAQTRSMLLCLLIVIALFGFFSFNKRTMKSFGKSMTQRSNVLFILIILGSTFSIITQSRLWELIIHYASGFFDSFIRAMLTASGQARGDDSDASASYRVSSIGYFEQLLQGQPLTLLFGEGYKRIYLDVPFLEAIVDCGIPGLIIFGGLLFVSLRESLKAMRRPTDDMRTFLAYFIIPTLLQAFTNGRPFDTSFLFMFALLARFIEPVKEPVVVQQPVAPPTIAASA